MPKNKTTNEKWGQKELGVIRLSIRHLVLLVRMDRVFSKRIKTFLILFSLVVTMLFSFPSDTTEDIIDDEWPYHYWEAPPDSFGVRSFKIMNWSYFWRLFYQHSMWDLEAYNPVTEEWVSCKEALTINRTRSEDNSSEKISLNFTAPAPITTDYRLTFAIDIRVSEYVNKFSWYEYVLTYPIPGYENLSYTVFFNWSDMKDIPGLIFKHGIKEIDGKDYFWFRCRRNNVPANYTLVLDPWFGYQEGGSSVDIKDYIRGVYAAPTGSGVVDNISVYIVNEKDWDMKCALYEYVDHSSSGAGVLLGETESKTVTATGWNTFDFTGTPPTVFADTNYYVCCWGEDGGGGNFKIGYIASGNKGIYKSETWGGAWANPLTDETIDSNTYDIYCSYTLNPCPTVYAPRTLNNATLVQQSLFERNDVITIRVNVTDESGRTDINTTLINITNTTGVAKVDDVTMANRTDITVGSVEGYEYEYNYTVPSDADFGEWTVTIYANDSLNSSDSNNVNFEIIEYGWLNITWAIDSQLNSSYTEGSPYTVNQNETFTMNATIKCEGDAGATCGEVQLGARYNFSGTMTYVSTTEGDTPFYVLNEGGGGSGDITNGTWYNMTPTVGDNFYERKYHGMVYDSNADRTMMFGGNLGPGGRGNDTWMYTYANNTWWNANPDTENGVFIERAYHKMVYDAAADRTIMFGGGSVTYRRNDTWIYTSSNNTWWNASPKVEGGTLYPRIYHSMTYDSSKRRVMMWGGLKDSAPPFLNDTWFYTSSNNTWWNASPKVEGGTFHGRDIHAIVYDASADRTILHAGNNPSSQKTNTTWIYTASNNTWWYANPQVVGNGGTLPKRARHTMVYDSSAERVIMFGGEGIGAAERLRDTWIYNSSDNTWYNTTPSFSGGTLMGRYAQSMVYDSSAKRTIMFGGSNGSTSPDELNDTWIYNFTHGAGNPQSLVTLNQGDPPLQVNFTINTTGTSGTWEFDLNATSSYPSVADNNTDAGYVLIGEAPGIVFDINRTSFDFGVVQNNTIIYSNATGGADTFRIYNNGSCNIDIDINGTNATATGVADWVLSPANGDNMYKMEIYNTTTGWFQVNLTADTWYSNMAQSTNITANLRITTPTVFYSGKQMVCTVYMVASVH